MIKEADLIIRPEVTKQLRVLAIEGYPFEVCGIIHKHDIVHQYPNTFCGDHRLGFDLEVDIQDDTIKAIWHSHPGGLLKPSSDDIPCMESLALHGYNFPWVIVTPKVVTAWVLESPKLLGAYSPEMRSGKVV